MNLLFAILVTYGLSLIIVHGSIFEGGKTFIKELQIDNEILSLLRNKFLQLVTCMLCTSFWIGAVAGAYFGLVPWYNIFFNGGILTATTWIIHCIMSYLGNGYDAGRVFNITITEPIKVQKVKPITQENINKEEKAVL